MLFGFSGAVYFSKGVKFLGAYLKPYVKYIDKRTKGNFYNLVHQINKEFITHKKDKNYLLSLLSCVNSYLGAMIHFSSYKLRKKILLDLKEPFYDYYRTDKNLSKIVLKAYTNG